MLYPDFKMRYSCLGQAEIVSSSDNKTATYALMDKNSFGRERYRLGHTLVFFRAGALAFLEELRFKPKIFKKNKFPTHIKKTIPNSFSKGMSL